MGRMLVVGVDAGGTSTRCMVADESGAIVGTGFAAGANPHSSGGDLGAALGAALERALPPGAREHVRAGIIGAAGAGGAAREALRSAAVRAWGAAGLGGEPVLVTDLEVAFAAGTSRPDGVLLLSGTGALAARFAAGELVQRCDGYGWLLGDDGSAVWLGVRALRAALRALDGRGGPTVLVDHVSRILGVTRHPDTTAEQHAQALIAAGHALAPAELGRLAIAVSEAAPASGALGEPALTNGALGEPALTNGALGEPALTSGALGEAASAGAVAPVRDTVAAGIAEEAAARLLHAYDTVGPGAVTVLAGSVLLAPGPVGRLVREGVRERTGSEPRLAVNGAGGAAVLALARVLGSAVPPRVHARLTASAHVNDEEPA